MITNHDSDAAERMKAMREIESEPLGLGDYLAGKSHTDAPASGTHLGDLLRSVTEPREGYLGVADRYFPKFNGSREQFEAVLGVAYITGQRDAIREILAKGAK